MRRAASTALALLAAAALPSGARAQGVTQFDGQYVGRLSLAGIIGGDCTTPPLGARYPLGVAGGEVRFKYVPRFDTTLVGAVNSNGDFKAMRRLRRGLVQMTGHIDAGRNVTATIRSPSCIYEFRTRE